MGHRELFCLGDFTLKIESAATAARPVMKMRAIALLCIPPRIAYRFSDPILAS